MPKKKFKLEGASEGNFSGDSNLTLSLRSGHVYERNETDRDLRCNIVPGHWPTVARARSVEKSSEQTR